MAVSDFQMWSEISLKRYLSVRKKNVDEDFETLVYRQVYKPLSSIRPEESKLSLFLTIKMLFQKISFYF